jgi:ribonuclease P protein component
MLPPAARLRRSSEFRDVVRRGRRARSNRLLVYTVLGDGRAGEVQPEVGFIVSKAVGISVVRHRVTRQLRALMHARLGALVPGSHVVIRALPAAAGASSVRLGRDLDRALSRAGAMAEPGGGAE